jgi:molybdate-binding protein
LVLQFSKFNSIKNQFISSKIEDHYLDKESVKKFIETLEDSFLKEKIQEFKKTKEIENEFN